MKRERWFLIANERGLKELPERFAEMRDIPLEDLAASCVGRLPMPVDREFGSEMDAVEWFKTISPFSPARAVAWVTKVRYRRGALCVKVKATAMNGWHGEQKLAFAVLMGAPDATTGERAQPKITSFSYCAHAIPMVHRGSAT